MNEIKVLIVEPNKEPYESTIKDELKVLQNIVGGHIEVIGLEQDIIIVCNEEGKIRDLEINRILENDVLCGTFFIAKSKGEEFTSLNTDEIIKYKSKFKLSNDIDKITDLKTKFKKSSDLLRTGNIWR